MVVCIGMSDVRVKSRITDTAAGAGDTYGVGDLSLRDHE